LSIRVSVVVPTYQRPRLLLNCLNALIIQNFPPDSYEIVVVDDADSEETRSLIENFLGETKCRKSGSGQWSGTEVDPCSRIRYAAATHTHGPAAARNIGWRLARGEIIAFTDDDCLPEPEWLREGVAALNDDLAGVSGQVIVPVPQDPTDYENNVARLANCDFVTANCFYRRSALEMCGGFDERFTMAWREDSDLQFKLLTLSQRLGCAPRARVIHPVRPAPWGISIKEQRKSMFDALLFKKYPRLFRELAHSGPPVKYYGIIFSSLGILAGIWTENKFLVLIMAVIWMGLIVQFSVQRLRHTKRTTSHILEMLLTSAVIPYLSIFWRLYGAIKFRVFFL
jgi:glycosyltransferase involved in cell wall biosynthesis